MSLNVLRVDSSARRVGSVTRDLADHFVSTLTAARPDAAVAVRDLLDGVPLLTEAWVTAKPVAPEERTPEQAAEQAVSDALIGEILLADVIVIGVPVYNFTIPASLKAWIDQVARPRLTFQYTASGPQGLLTGKKAVLVMGSAGTPADAPHNFATEYLKFVLGFLGITDVTVVDTGALISDADTKLQASRDALTALAAHLVEPAAQPA